MTGLLQPPGRRLGQMDEGLAPVGQASGGTLTAFFTMNSEVARSISRTV